MKRKQVTFDDATLTIITDYRKSKNPIPSFSQAVRDIIKEAKSK